MSDMKTQEFKSNTIEFQITKDILFPKICIICGNNTEDQYRKVIKGASSVSRDYYEEYLLNLPVCSDCRKNIDIKTGISSKSGRLIGISSLIGIIVALILYFLTFSIFLSIGLFALALIIPFVRYRETTSKKVKINDFLMIRLGKDKSTLVFDFLNENYVKFINEINVRKEKSEEVPEETN